MSARIPGLLAAAALVLVAGGCEETFLYGDGGDAKPVQKAAVPAEPAVVQDTKATPPTRAGVDAALKSAVAFQDCIHGCYTAESRSDTDVATCQLTCDGAAMASLEGVKSAEVKGATTALVKAMTDRMARCAGACDTNTSLSADDRATCTLDCSHELDELLGDASLTAADNPQAATKGDPCSPICAARRELCEDKCRADKKLSKDDRETCALTCESNVHVCVENCHNQGKRSI